MKSSRLPDAGPAVDDALRRRGAAREARRSPGRALEGQGAVDEPTTGLHPRDIRKLLDAFQRLVAEGHSVVIIEHNLDVIKSADHVIDLGPEGGAAGGPIVCAGTSEKVAACERGHTGRFLQEVL